MRGGAQSKRTLRGFVFRHFVIGGQLCAFAPLRRDSRIVSACRRTRARSSRITASSGRSFTAVSRLAIDSSSRPCSASNFPFRWWASALAGFSASTRSASTSASFSWPASNNAVARFSRALGIPIVIAERALKRCDRVSRISAPAPTRRHNCCTHRREACAPPHRSASLPSVIRSCAIASAPLQLTAVRLRHDASRPRHLFAHRVIGDQIFERAYGFVVALQVVERDAEVVLRARVRAGTDTQVWQRLLITPKPRQLAADGCLRSVARPSLERLSPRASAMTDVRRCVPSLPVRGHAATTRTQIAARARGVRDRRLLRL